MSTTEFNNKHRSNEESRQSRYAIEKKSINMIQCSSNAKISTKKSQQIYLRLLPQDQWSSIHSCPTAIVNTLEKLTSMKKLKYTHMNHNRYPQHETTFENVSSSAIQFIFLFSHWNYPIYPASIQKDITIIIFWDRNRQFTLCAHLFVQCSIDSSEEFDLCFLNCG